MSNYGATLRTSTPTLELASTEKLFKLPLIWLRRSNQRRQLAKLDARLLDDVGISYADAQAEARKPFWVE